jgi:hypothetical protein
LEHYLPQRVAVAAVVLAITASMGLVAAELEQRPPATRTQVAAAECPVAKLPECKEPQQIEWAEEAH